ncbi:MAG: PRC-barrel domain-containing protein [Candidatus Micrarchaeia archaeon]
MKISEIYNMDIYSDAGQYLGEVRDAIIDLEKGEVSRLLMEEWHNSGKEEVKRLLQQKSIIFKNIKSIEDVVLVSAGTNQYRKSENENSSEVTDLANR